MDPEAFQAWARTEHSVAFKAAMMDHVRGRNVAAYATLADKYMTKS